MSQESPKITETASNLKKILSNNNYFDNYGDSIIATVVIICIVIYIIINNFVNQQKEIIKKDWDKNRCNPMYIPFSGKIHKRENQTEKEATSENLEYCLGNITKDVANNAFKPVNMITESVSKIFAGFFEALNSLRNMFDYVRTKIGKILASVMLKIMIILLPLQRVIMSINDIFQKSGGLVFTSMMILTGSYMTVMAGIDGLILVAIMFLVYLLIQAAILYAIPFVGWALALAFTILATTLSIYIGTSTSFKADAVDNSPGKENMANMEKENTSHNNNDNFQTKLKNNQKYFTEKLNSLFSKKTKQPKNHDEKNKDYEACFAGETLINVWGNKKIFIKDLILGDRLADGSYVTALFTASSVNQDFYSINNIIVTGNHKLLYDDRWIKVCEHPSSIELPNYQTELVYCINTTSKKIYINGLFFSDWDDLDEYDFIELRVKTLKYTVNPLTHYSVHKHLDGGFKEDTMIELEDGRSVKISDICVNDVLRFGENVLGIVKICTSDLSCIKEFKINNNKFIGGPNLLYFEEDCAVQKTVKLLDIKCKELDENDKSNVLYHLVTDKSTFFINGVKFYDYNGSIEYFLDEDSKKLLQTIIF